MPSLDPSNPQMHVKPKTHAYVRNVGEYVGAVAPSVAAQLISRGTLSRIQKIAALLPGALTDFFGFECVLSNELELADFLVCCRNRQAAREILADQTAGWCFPPPFEKNPVWQRIRAFSQVWTNPASPLYQEVHNVWMEFDINGTSPEIPVPSIFIGSHHLRAPSQYTHLFTIPAHCAWLTDLAMPLLLESEIEISLRKQIARCVNLLTPSAFVFQVGLMLTRVHKTTRLCIRGVSPGAIIEYLKAIDWEGRVSDLECLLESLAQNVAGIDLDIDVADHVLPKIGLECYMTVGHFPAFLTYLVSSNLCTPQKRWEIEQWQGITDDYPSSGVFIRSLHHVKIVYEFNTVLGAKAYLGVHHKTRPQG